MNEHIKSLVEKLDWRADPRPSPYQKRAWEELVTLPRESVKQALQEYSETLRKDNPSFYPYNYAIRLP
jgi:hypothetical protein